MPKVRWTEARWAKRAQKARALAKNTRVQVRRRMMLEVAEFYDRLAKLTRDFKTQGRGSRRRAAGTQQGERSRGASAYRWKAERTVDRIQEVGGRAADCGAPTGKATTSPQRPTCECAVRERDWRLGGGGQRPRPATLEV
jgi:hypothetical protein